MVRVLLADDHQIVRDGLKMILQSSPNYVVVAEASNGNELVEKAIKSQPELIISDLKMPGKSIIETSKLIKEKLPNSKVIILTAYDDSGDIYQAIDCGIDGYIMKDTLPQQIINTIEMVLMGYSCFQPKLLQTPHNDKILIKFIVQGLPIYLSKKRSSALGHTSLFCYICIL